jgi:ribonuclease HI
MIIIYTDGASKGNPGRGGYGVVMLSPSYNLRKELAAGYRLTTNNRMELLAVIVGLETLKIPNSEVIIYSDSAYVVNSVEKGWLWAWVKKGFAGKKNEDLWRRFIPAYKQHKVKLQWIKGHSNIPENERCDKLSVDAANGTNLLIDEGYENGLGE